MPTSWQGAAGTGRSGPVFAGRWVGFTNWFRMLPLTEARLARRMPHLRKALGLALKCAATVGCFWYLGRSIDMAELMRAARELSPAWLALAVVLVMAQIPLVGLRWQKIVASIDNNQQPLGPIVAITAIATFFGQILPQVVGDTLRIGMLTRRNANWRSALASVLIDRAVGVAALLAIAIVTLLPPSALAGTSGYRNIALALFATVLVAALGCLGLAPWISPILRRWRATRLIGDIAEMSHQTLIRSPERGRIVLLAIAVHLLTILVIGALARAQGLPLSLIDCGLLFTVMVAAALIPISVSGWGVRELAVTTLLAAHGIPREQALFFSVCFGLVLLCAALPGLAVWVAYSTRRPVQAG